MTDSIAGRTLTSVVKSPSIQAPALEGPAAPIRPAAVSNVQTLVSIRGIPSCESVQPNALAPDSAFDETYSADLHKLWIAARLNPREDRGGDLRKLVEAFETDAGLEENEELITQLSRVAKSEVLFGKTRAEFSAMGIDFDKVRREFLVDVIRGTIDSDNITQGSEPLCTIASAVKLLPKAEFLRLATDLALKGEATAQSGAAIRVWPEEFLHRAHKYSEAQLGDVKSARRSLGMLTMLYSVLQLGDQEMNPRQPLVSRQEGLYWHQYTEMVQKLLGEKVACAHRSAKDIAIDGETERAVAKGTPGAREVDLFGYLEAQLNRERRVFIDTVFDFSTPGRTVGNEHSRHALIAEKFEEINGERWVRCSNPIGDFVDSSKSREGYAEFVRTGAILGRQDGFWFKTDKNGDILVRADVLRANIQTALVMYGEPYTHREGDSPVFIGDQRYETHENSRPIRFFEFQSNPSDIHDLPSRAETIEDTLQKLFQEEERRFGPSVSSHGDYSNYNNAPSARKKRLEEELTEVFETERIEAQQEQEEKRSKEERILGEPAPQGAQDRSSVVNRTLDGQTVEDGVTAVVRDVHSQTPTQSSEAPHSQASVLNGEGSPQVAAKSSSLITKTLFG